MQEGKMKGEPQTARIGGTPQTFFLYLWSRYLKA